MASYHFKFLEWRTPRPLTSVPPPPHRECFRRPCKVLLWLGATVDSIIQSSVSSPESPCSEALQQPRQQSTTAFPPQRWVVTFTFPPLCLLGLTHGEPWNLPLHPQPCGPHPPLWKSPLKGQQQCTFQPSEKGGKTSFRIRFKNHSAPFFYKLLCALL